MPLSKALQRLPLGSKRPDIEHNQQRHKPEEIGVFHVAEYHGSLRNRVFARIFSNIRAVIASISRGE